MTVFLKLVCPPSFQEEQDESECYKCGRSGKGMS